MFSLISRRGKRWIRRCLDGAILAMVPKPEGQMISRLKSDNLTYLKTRKLASISKTCNKCLELDGMFIEAGCALGGSAILATFIKDREREMRVYDVFGMIPPPTDRDPEDVQVRYKEISEGKSPGIGGEQYYGYMDDLEDIVRSNFKKYGLLPSDNNVFLIKGLLEETMEISSPVAFAHIDVDWYQPVFESLVRITPCLSVGGSIILDDYFDWGGCRKATDDFLSANPEIFKKDGTSGALKLTKIL